MAATAFGLGWLVLVLGALLWNGFGGTIARCFHRDDTPSRFSVAGLLNPIVGSLMITMLAVVIGTPIGILAGTYMAEYGRYDRLTSVVRFINDILLSAPSIVIGLFIYEVMVAPMGHFSGWAGGVALAGTGQVEGWDDALARVRRGGRVVFFGGCPQGTALSVDTRRMHYDNLTLIAPFHYRPRDVRRAYELLAGRALNAGAIVTARKRLADLAEVFDMLDAARC